MQDMVAIFTLNTFRLPVGLQLTIENILCLIFFGTNVARKLLFFRMGQLVTSKILIWNQFPAGLAKRVVHFEITQRINVWNDYYFIFIMCLSVLNRRTDK